MLRTPAPLPVRVPDPAQVVQGSPEVLLGLHPSLGRSGTGLSQRLGASGGEGVECVGADPGGAVPDQYGTGDDVITDGDRRGPEVPVDGGFLQFEYVGQARELRRAGAPGHLVGGGVHGEQDLDDLDRGPLPRWFDDLTEGVYGSQPGPLIPQGAHLLGAFGDEAEPTDGGGMAHRTILAHQHQHQHRHRRRTGTGTGTVLERAGRGHGCVRRLRGAPNRARTGGLSVPRGGPALLQAQA
jgi:hypothetical protein